MRACEHCSKPFEPVKSWQRHCSRQCYLAEHKVRQREKYRRRRSPVEFDCQACGEHVVSIAPDNRRKYCSSACQGRNSRVSIPRDMSPRPCAYCCTVFSPQYGSGRWKFCSSQCHDDGANERRKDDSLLLDDPREASLPMAYTEAVQALRQLERSAQDAQRQPN